MVTGVTTLTVDSRRKAQGKGYLRQVLTARYLAFTMRWYTTGYLCMSIVGALDEAPAGVLPAQPIKATPATFFVLGRLQPFRPHSRFHVVRRPPTSTTICPPFRNNTLHTDSTRWMATCSPKKSSDCGARGRLSTRWSSTEYVAHLSPSHLYCPKMLPTSRSREHTFLT